jgi:hypothetical protein
MWHKKKINSASPQASAKTLLNHIKESYCIPTDDTSPRRKLDQNYSTLNQIGSKEVLEFHIPSHLLMKRLHPQNEQNQTMLNWSDNNDRDDNDEEMLTF